MAKSPPDLQRPYPDKLGKRIARQEIESCCRKPPSPRDALCALVARKHADALELLYKHFGLKKPARVLDDGARLAYLLACNHVPAFQFDPPRGRSSAFRKAWTTRQVPARNPVIDSIIIEWMDKGWKPPRLKQDLPRKGRPPDVRSGNQTLPLCEQDDAALLRTVNGAGASRAMGRGEAKRRIEERLTLDAIAAGKSIFEYIETHSSKLQNRLSRAAKRAKLRVHR